MIELMVSHRIEHCAKERSALTVVYGKLYLHSIRNYLALAEFLKRHMGV